MAIQAQYTWRDGVHEVPPKLDGIWKLAIPDPGSYVIFAKVVIGQGSANTSKVQPNQVTALLEAEGDSDTSVVTVPIASENPFRSGAATIFLSLSHKFSGPDGKVVLSLDKKPDATPFLEWSHVKITAIPVDVHRQPPP
jgi:hypothetical protein